MKDKKRMKKLLSLTVIGIMMITTLSGGASAQTINGNTDVFNTAASVFDFDDIVTLEALDVEYNFEMFRNSLRENISEEELNEAERLFNEANNANEESQKLWQELYAMDIFNVEKSLNSSNTSNIKLSQLDTINIEDFDLEDFCEKSKIQACTVGNLSDSKSVVIKLGEFEDEANLTAITINKVESVNDQFTCSLAEFESYEYTFDMFKEGLKEDISEEDLAKAEELFIQATELSQKSNDLWNELYAMDIYNYEKDGQFSCGFDGNSITIEEYKPEN